jgi:hypothetical protein
MVLFLIGLYFPSSVGGEQSAGFLVREMILLFGLFGALAVSCGIGRFRLQLIGCLIPLVIVVCTFLSPFGSYAIGAIYIYVLLVFLYNLNLRTVQPAPQMRTALVAANIINLVLGLGIILQSDAVTGFLQEHYTYFYPELLATMFALRKPVLTFGSHSVAAFYTFLFFWMNLKTYEREKRSAYLFLAITQIVFCLFLFSFTSFFFFACELAMLIRTLVQRGRKFTIRFAVVLGVVIIFALGMLRRMLIYDPEWNYQITEYATSLLTSTENGPVGRYSSSGNLAADLKYLADNPLRPVGLSKPNALFFMDSGPVEYLLRGSFPLLLLIYGGLYIFLCDNMIARRDALALFIVIVLFETGFPILLHLRTLYLLPFFVVYMNGLGITPKAESLFAFGGRAAIETS